jgi:REP element-mobilizing transposase RayT
MSHTFTDILIHSLFSTRDREPILDTTLRSELFSYMGGILKHLGCQPLLINGPSDHVHLLFVLPPRLPRADVIEKVKANASKWVHEWYTEKRDFAWQQGYTAFSVSPSNRQRVLDYIVRQEEHHRRRTFQEEVLAFLKKAGIPFDSKRIFK